jgi:DNA-binding transcriptional ArsR family regulator
MTAIKDYSGEERYLIFQALSHRARVKILSLLASNDLSFSSLKHEVGMESSGQLQHHLQKLSGLIEESESGSYGLTSMGRRALEIYRESEKSGSPLDEICCLPTHSELAHDKQINGRGIWLRCSIGLILSALTAGIVANFLFPHQMYLKAFVVFGGGNPWWSWIPDAIVFGFFGASFLISAVSGYPGCEVTAIPNLLTKKKRYCSCLIIPFNVPNGSLLQGTSKQKKVHPS